MCIIEGERDLLTPERTEPAPEESGALQARDRDRKPNLLPERGSEAVRVVRPNLHGPRLLEEVQVVGYERFDHMVAPTVECAHRRCRQRLPTIPRDDHGKHHTSGEESKPGNAEAPPAAA